MPDTLPNKQRKSRRTPLRFDDRTGRWCAKLGRKKTRSGKFDGHLFRFSPDEKESERRKVLIQDVWDRLVDGLGDNALWTKDSLRVAKAIGEGKRQVAFRLTDVVDCDGGDAENPAHDFDYALGLKRLQFLFPQVEVVPADSESHRNGVEDLSYIGEGLIEEGRFLSVAATGSDPTQPSIREALSEFGTYFRATLLVTPEPEEGIEGNRLSDTAQKYLVKLDTIRVQNAEQLDWPISRLTYDGCDAMLQVWRDRPLKSDVSGPMAVKTCREHAKLIMRFFRWLSRSDDFEWTKPVDFDLLKLNIKPTNREKAAPVTSHFQQVKTYTVAELAILNEYANPFERFLIVCGLNLGFKRMECSTLRAGEICLGRKHEFARYINFDFKDDDSFVRRLRTKTEVFGEWILWPLTVQAMEWVSSRRMQQTHIMSGDGEGRAIPSTPDSVVFLNDRGHSFTKPTKSGNANNQLTNAWNRLLRRVRQDYKDFNCLPHESLRDTAANWIRSEFDGEVAEVFLAHGSPLGSKSLIESYTNKPFGKVFKAVKWLEAKLQPMFEASPAEPFPTKRKKGGGGLTPKQKKMIRELSEATVPVRQIAAQVGCSVMSVYRHQKPV